MGGEIQHGCAEQCASAGRAVPDYGGISLRKVVRAHRWLLQRQFGTRALLSGLPEEGPSCLRCVQQPGRRGDPVNDPKRRRARRDSPERRLLAAQRTKVGQAVPAIGHHHRQVAHHAAVIVPGPARLQTGQAQRQRLREPGLVGDLGEQRAARMRHQPSPSALTSTVKLRASHCTFKVILPSRSCRPRTPAESLLTRTVLQFYSFTVSAAPTIGAATASCMIRASLPT